MTLNQQMTYVFSFSRRFTPSDQGILVIHREDWLTPTSGKKPKMLGRFSSENLGDPSPSSAPAGMYEKKFKSSSFSMVPDDSKHQHIIKPSSNIFKRHAIVMEKYTIYR